MDTSISERIPFNYRPSGHLIRTRSYRIRDAACLRYVSIIHFVLLLVSLDMNDAIHGLVVH